MGGKAGGKKGGTVSTYQQYLNAQKAMANKADKKNSNRFVDQAEALRSQANALLTLLGRSPGRSGLGYTTGPQGAGGKSPGAHAQNIGPAGGIGGNWNTGGNGFGGGGGKHGIRTGTDVLNPPGRPPKYGGANGQGGPAVNMPRTVNGRNAQVEGTGGSDNVKGSDVKNGGKGHPGGWGSNWDWKKDKKPGQDDKDGKKDKDKRGDRNLRDKGLSGELRTNLKNVERAMRTADEILMTGYGERVGALSLQVEGNEKSANTQSYANQANRGRERANAMSELAAQGAGESDALRGQGMALRNWSSNQNEVNRAFHDSAESINASLTDLTTDTRSARVQNQQQAIDDKAQLWNSYFDAKSEAETQLGNTYGQMADYYDQADDAKHGKKKARRAKRLQRKSDKWFGEAAQTGSQAHKTQKVDDELIDWQGHAAFEHKLNNNVVQQTGQKQAVPEGATLRKWNA
jgi:hypothetical protein